VKDNKTDWGLLASFYVLFNNEKQNEKLFTFFAVFHTFSRTMTHRAYGSRRRRKHGWI